MTYAFAQLLKAHAAIAGEYADVATFSGFDAHGTLHVTVHAALSVPQLAAVERAIRRRLPSQIDDVPVRELKLHVQPRAAAVAINVNEALSVHDATPAVALAWRLTANVECPRCRRPIDSLVFVRTLAGVVRCPSRHCNAQHAWALRLRHGHVAPQIIAAVGEAIGPELVERFALPATLKTPMVWTVALSSARAERCRKDVGSVLLAIARQSGSGGTREVAR